MFERFLSPLTIRQAEFRNRVVATGHKIRVIANGLPTESIGSMVPMPVYQENVVCPLLRLSPITLPVGSYVSLHPTTAAIGGEHGRNKQTANVVSGR